MKKTFFRMLPFVAAVVLAASCGKDGDDNSNVIDNPLNNEPAQDVVVDNQVKMIPFSITVSKPSVTKASLQSEDGLTQVFETGDYLVIGDNLVTLDLLEGAGETTATFSKEIPEGTLTPGTEYAVVLKSKVHTSCGSELTTVQSALSMKEAFENFGYLTSTVTYNGTATEKIMLVQNTVFLRIKGRVGETSVSVNGISYSLTDGQCILAVKSGSEIESNLFSGKKTVTNDGGKVVKIIDRSDCLAGVFSISDTKKVCFSKGNLWYHCTNHDWRFADKQWYVIDYSNRNISDSYNGYIDLFGWGMWLSGENPTNTSRSNDDYLSSVTKDDFKGISAIGSQWMSLSISEWQYLFNFRTDASSKYGTGSVHGYGVILLPDSWTLPEGLSFSPGEGSWSSNSYTTEQWSMMETAGAVFLPVACYRSGSVFYSEEPGRQKYNVGRYWSSSANDSDEAWFVSFGLSFGGLINIGQDCSDARFYGQSVRLVRLW